MTGKIMGQDWKLRAGAGWGAPGASAPWRWMPTGLGAPRSCGRLLQRGARSGCVEPQAVRARRVNARANPKGIVTPSPGLRGTSYPGGGVPNISTTPPGLRPPSARAQNPGGVECIPRDCLRVVSRPRNSFQLLQSFAVSSLNNDPVSSAISPSNSPSSFRQSRAVASIFLMRLSSATNRGLSSAC